MDSHARHDRTVRLLATRLETLAVASLRSPGGERTYRHAVALDLLSPKEADTIWADVARRHPEAGWCRSGPRLAA
jgi:hypothetical protein